MSPASQGGVEVERYIGGCLISSTINRPIVGRKREPVIGCYGGQSFSSCTEQCRMRYVPGGWTGAPLVSMMQRRSSPSRQACDPLSRLAIHTQGAPLILAGDRFHNRGKAHNNGTVRCPPSRPQRPMDGMKKQQTNPKSDCSTGKEVTGNIDSLSVASDESSGSNNSENSLPRIIKPRKRRKKDRKPATGTVTSTEVAKHVDQQQQSVPSLAGEHVVSSKPYNLIPGCYEAAPTQLRNHRRPPMARESVHGRAAQDIGDAGQRYRHVEVKVLDDNRNGVVRAQKGYRYNNSHRGDVPRYPREFNDEDGTRDRYCDPLALMWDRNCYSPFLTPSSEFCPSHFSRTPLFLSRQSFSADNARNNREKDSNCGGGVALRRSWSDPTSYFSEEISVPSKDVGVIGDRGQAETGKRRTFWRGDSIGVPASNGATVQPPKGLEVSTEIITSPNGHRDLEIKFYSPSPNLSLPEEDKADDEDFSDIWSYHESKLQQHFRALLQAEE